MKAIIAVLALSLVGGIFGYYFGYSRESKALDVYLANVTDPTEQRAALLTLDRVRDSAKWGQALDEALRANHYGTFRNRLRNGPWLSENELKRTIEALDEMDHADNWYFELLSRWAQEDAAAALDFARSELSGSNQYQGLCGLFEHLAKSDAQGAFIQWSETMNQLDDPKNAQGSLLAIMGHWWTKDLDGAMTAIQSLEDSSDRYSALNGCFGDSFVNASASDKERLLTAIKVLPDEGNRNHGLSAYASALARNRSLEEMGTWIEDQELEGEAAASAERGAAGAYLTKDPSKAAQWLGERATTESLSEHLKYVVVRWAMHEPNAVGKWLGTFEVSQRTDNAMEAYANTIAHDDIESAFYWGQNIHDPERRFQALTRYAQRWAREDPGAVAGTISRSNLTPDQQAELMSRIER